MIRFSFFMVVASFAAIIALCVPFAAIVIAVCVYLMRSMLSPYFRRLHEITKVDDTEF